MFLKYGRYFIRHAVRGPNHGLSRTPEYVSWTCMKGRCYNRAIKSFKHYGGRGIKVCDRWLQSFENFLADMGERPSLRHTIERINNDGNYEPNNCKWIIAEHQALNRRSTKITRSQIADVVDLIRSKDYTHLEIAKIYGVSESNIAYYHKKYAKGAAE
jgi:hypothetical protein